MPSTRRPPAVEIYQDEPDTTLAYMQSSAQHPQPHLRSGMRPPPHLAPSAMPLQAVHNPPTTSHMMPHGMLVGTPVTMPPGLSPTKRPMYGPPVTNLHMMPVMPPVTTPQMMAAMTQSPVEDSFNAAYYGQPTFKPMPPQPMYSMWNLNSGNPGQESMHNAMAMPENAPYPVPNPRKRSNSDAASIADRPNKKRKGEPESYFVLPEPHEMPPIEDPGDKPSYSYAMMIGMAILRSPNRQLTLSGIYGWIQDSFTYYRNQELGAGWQNSIRHNLSLSKAFKKRPRPKEDTGKGCYWYISEGEEAQFMTQRTRKGAANGNMIVQHDTIGQQTMQVMAPVSHEQLQPQHWVPPVSTNMPPPLQRPQTAPAPEQLRHVPLTDHLPTVSTPNHPPLPLLDGDDDDDSDATIPASDTILEEADASQLPTNFLALQDLPADELNKGSVSQHSQPIIGSSPPILLHSNRRQSSPAEFLPPVLPVKGPRRRNPVTLNDSGYHSDFQSSARKRDGQSSKGRQTDHDFSAQAEIMRMRSSPSYQSHVHMRSAVEPLAPATPAYGSSISKRNPITPRLLGVPPVQFLASVSPTGQLYNFRHQFQESPTRGTSDLQNVSPTGEVEDFFGNAFHPHEMSTGTPLLSPPFKVPGSSKRPGIFRSNTTTAVLSDVTKQVRNKQNARTPSKVPVLKPSVLSSMARLASPTKTDLLQQFQFPGVDYGSDDENFDMGVFLNSERDYENENPYGKTENEASELSDGYDLANGFPMIAGKANYDDDFDENNDSGATMKAKASTIRQGIRRHISSLI